MGLSYARNVGLKEVKSPWVVFIDSDDLVAPRLCEHCLQAAETFATDVVFFDHLTFSDGGLPPPEALATTPVLADRAKLLLRQSFAWTKLTRTDFLRQRGIEYPLGLCLQDVPVHWRLVLESEKPVFLDEPLVWYRQRANSISYRSNWTRADGFIVYDLVREYLHRTQLWEIWHAHFIQRELMIFADIHFNFVNTNPNLVARAHVEIMRRMTVRHWAAAIVGDNIGRVQRDFILAECRPDACNRAFSQILPVTRHALRNLLRRPWRMLRNLLRA
jgi:glycosyltransferase involved in cell wall biosynthesis